MWLRPNPVYGEWWIVEGQARYAKTGDDLGHEAVVYDHLTRLVLEVVGDDAADAELVELPMTYEGETGEEVDLDGDELDRVLEPVMPDDEQRHFAVRVLLAPGDFRPGRRRSQQWQGPSDPRDFAMRYWGWIRVSGESAQMDTLTAASLQALAHGLAEMGHVTDRDTFAIEVRRRFFLNVPFWVIAEAKPGLLREYEYR